MIEINRVKKAIFRIYHYYSKNCRGRKPILQSWRKILNGLIKTKITLFLAIVTIQCLFPEQKGKPFINSMNL